MKKYLPLVLIFVLALGMLTGCKKKKGDPPVLPPAESMSIDFTNFDSGKKSGDFLTFEKGVENSNWEFSALVAGYFKAIITGTLAVPVATFKKALDQTPAFLEEKTWQWSFSTTILSVTYKARLVGQIRTSDVLWKMYITREGTGGFAEFIWFEGTSKLDASSGQWTLNHSSQFKEPLLQIDWTKTATGIGTVKYTYVRAQNDNRVTDPFKTSYIEYGKTTGTTYNAYYNVHYYNGMAFSDMNVEWSTTGKNGRVKCTPYFGDSNWYCWNANYVNIVCP